MLQMNDNSLFFFNSDSSCLKFANEIKVQNGTSQDVCKKKNLSFTGFRSPCSTNTHPHKLSIGQGPSLCR